jgi:hypothetical protein
MAKERMYSWMNKKLEVRDTIKYGKGVFATAEIAKDEMLFVMGGYIYDIDDENNISDYSADKPIEISEEFSICPPDEHEMEKMPQHYVNHSCDPNAGFKGQIFMVAMKPISAGEEIVYDYAMIIHSNPRSEAYFTMNCHCGSKACRGVIDEEGWQIPELQSRYDGYFQWYLQEKINKLKNK